MKYVWILLAVLLLIAVMFGCEKEEVNTTTLYYDDNGIVHATAYNGYIIPDQTFWGMNDITYEDKDVFQHDVAIEIIMLREEIARLREELLEFYIASGISPKTDEEIRYSFPDSEISFDVSGYCYFGQGKD